MRTSYVYRVSQKEKADIQFNAEMCGLDVSNYSRKILFGEHKPHCALPPEYYRVRKELTAVLNNLTQISKVANAHDLPIADRAHKNAEEVRMRIFKIRYGLEN